MKICNYTRPRYNVNMQIQEHVRLADYSTMRLGGAAQALATVHTRDELLEALAWAESHSLPTLMLGGGSNVIFSNGYAGLVIVNQIAGFEVIEKNNASVTIRVGAGENWDSVVARTVDMGLSGIEKLSFIPGTAGATPVQNVGAYGAEIADVFVELEAYDLKTRDFVTLDKSACQFSYRNSIFKATDDRRYIITSITLQLSTSAPTPPFYDALQKYLDEHNIREYSVGAIREAVIAIRTIKLPDPKKIANTGSFFKNPIIAQADFARIEAKHPDIPHWQVGEKVKIPAGWLIDKTGLKGYRAHGMKVYQHNALVFVNESAESYDDLAAFRQEVIDRVREEFGVTLEQEPELI